MTRISLQKVKSLPYLSGLGVRQGCGKVTKMTRFCHKMRHIKPINTEIFCELLKPFLLIIHETFFSFFLKIQNKSLFIVLKFRKFLQKSFFKDSCKASNIQLINKKFGSNIDGHMKKHY